MSATRRRGFSESPRVQKPSTSPRPSFRRKLKRTKSETERIYRANAEFIADFANMLTELNNLKKYIKKDQKQDMKDLQEMVNNWAEQENPNLHLLKSNIEFWKGKLGVREGGKRRRMTRKNRKISLRRR